MEIPANIRVSLCIERGSVFNFYMEMSGTGRSSKNRYFVVLNKYPKTDSALVLVTSTTQIAKRKEFIRRVGISEKTIVVVLPSEYPVFISKSAFNCNDVFEVDIKNLINKIEKGGSMGYPKMPDSILSKLIIGINESPSVTSEIKKLL